MVFLEDEGEKGDKKKSWRKKKNLFFKLKLNKRFFFSFKKYRKGNYFSNKLF